jgi:hypothetical protein
LALALRRRGLAPLLVEADPAGGVLGLRFGLPSEPSLATLAGAAGRGNADPELLWSHCVDLGGAPLLASPSDGLIATWALGRSTTYLAEVLRSLGRPVILDIGRIEAASPALALLPAADLVTLVCRPNAEEAQAMMYGSRTVKRHCARMGLVTVGDRPFRSQELADLAGIPLLGVVPDDPRVARALVGGRHSRSTFRRSLLMRSIDSLARSVFPPHVVSRRRSVSPPAPPAPPAHTPLAGPDGSAAATLNAPMAALLSEVRP